MAKRLTVVVSQGQSANPAKRQLEEEIVAALLFERGIEVTVIPNLYDLAPDGTGMLCLQGIAGDMVVLSWLYPRAAHWVLSRNNVKGHEGKILLTSETEEDEGEFDDEEEAAADESEAAERRGVGARDVPNRRIYCLDLRARSQPAPFIEEIKRIVADSSVKTVDLMSWVQGTPRPDQLERYLAPADGNGDGSLVGLEPHTGNGQPHNGQAASAHDTGQPTRIAEEPARRWYPVIDFSRCTNCMECLDFCLFGVYGVDRSDTILVEQPDNCRKGCPACSRVCPENAIIFPQHKTPAIAGGEDQAGGGFKIDLSRLFGAPDALEVAAQERDEQLQAVGREAVGMTVGMPKRQQGKAAAPKDELDNLMDQLDSLDL